MKKLNRTLEEAIVEEFGDITPFKKKFKRGDFDAITEDDLVEAFGSFWEKFVYQTSLIYFTKLREWAIQSTLKRWYKES